MRVDRPVDTASAARLAADAPLRQSPSADPALPAPAWRPASAPAALFFLSYVLACGVAQWLAIIPGTGISLWPPAGLFLATLIVAARPLWPAWIGLALGAELFANAVWFHNASGIAVVLNAGNALCAVTGAWLLTRNGTRPVRLETLRDVLELIVLGGLVAPVTAATVGAATLWWWEGQPFGNAWSLWWIGDVTGTLLVAPLVLVALEGWRDKALITRARLAEATALGVVLLALAVLSLDGRVPYPFIVLPPILWAAVRFQFKGAVVTLAALALLAALFTGAGRGPFAGDPASQEERHVMLQVFLLVSALSALVVAALSQQHQDALRSLQAANDRLEQRVEERTRALRQSDQRFHALADSVPVIVWVTDAAGRMEFVNREFEAFFGVTEAQVRDDGWQQVVHPDDVRGYTETAREALRAKREFQHTARVRRADGAWRYVASRGVPRRAADGRFLGLVGVSLDMTARREHEQALAEASRQKDEFLAMLAHELRNPLAPVRNAVELLRFAGRGDAGVEHARAIIERQIAHMVRLVDDLMDVARVSRGKITLERVPVHLGAVVQQAVETHRSFIDARGHRVVTTLPDDVLCVTGDFTRLAQAVGNLVNNAAKYSEHGSDIAITVARGVLDGRAVARIHVRDNGRGIDPAAMGSLFEMFYQADNTLDRAEGGLGVGLALVRRLAELHGGTVTAASAGRELGSEFVLTLPLAACSQGADSAVPPAAASPPAARRRVLVVDDNRDAADSMAALLRADGHDVLTAYDGQRAVELALHVRPSVVLLDIGLPSLDGYAACRAMRHAGLHDTLVVALTGYGQAEDLRSTADAGFDAHCVKPVDLGLVRSLLARAAPAAPATH